MGKFGVYNESQKVKVLIELICVFVMMPLAGTLQINMVGVHAFNLKHHPFNTIQNMT